MIWFGGVTSGGGGGGAWGDEANWGIADWAWYIWTYPLISWPNP